MLRQRGHRVVFAAESSWAGRLEPLGFVEDLVDLAPPPDQADGDAGAGQFWTDFIRETAPEFRKPTIEQLESFVRPTWQALIDGAKYSHEQLSEIIARHRPDVIIEDNVNCFPALLTAGVPFVRMMSCNPLEMRGPDVPPVFSGYPSDDPSGWDEFRAEYERTHRDLWADYDEWVQSVGAPPLPDLDFIHVSEHLNLYLYPTELDYTAHRPLGADLASSRLVGADDRRGLRGARATALEWRRPSAGQRAGVPVARLARLGRHRPDAPARRHPRLAPATASSVSKGPLRRRVRAPGEHVRRGASAPDLGVAAGRPRDHPRRQQHDHGERPLRQADGRCCRCSGTSTTTPSGSTSSASVGGCRPTRSTDDELIGAVDELLADAALRRRVADSRRRRARPRRRRRRRPAPRTDGLALVGAEQMVAAARPISLWLDRLGHQPARPPVESTAVDLLVVGAGLTGLWASFEAARQGHDVTVVDSATVGSGATGRCGGFINASITHGIANGHARWPDEMPAILDIQRRLWDDTLMPRQRRGALARRRRRRSSNRSASTPWRPARTQVAEINAAVTMLRSYGEDVEQFDGEEIRRRLGSTSYLGGYHLRSANGLCDPARLTARLAETRRGGRCDDRRALARRRSPPPRRWVVVSFATGRRCGLDGCCCARTRHRRCCDGCAPSSPRSTTMPSPPSHSPSRCGTRSAGAITPESPTPATSSTTTDRRPTGASSSAAGRRRYHFGGRVDARYEHDPAVHALLYRHLVAVHPALEGMAISHAWGGAVDSTSRFTPTIHTAAGGRIGWAVGFTGLGVGASRFGALAALDLLLDRSTQRTELSLVRRQPVPFPPEPLRWLVIQFTKRALISQDVTGRRGLWLRFLDRLGVGFDT